MCVVCCCRRYCLSKFAYLNIEVINTNKKNKARTAKHKTKKKKTTFDFAFDPKHQDCHVDYNFIKLFDTKLMKQGVTAPLVCILALEVDTKIVLYTNTGIAQVFDIPIGHLFIMAGDCPHGGFAYVKTNSRIHWYLEAEDLKTSDANQTGTACLVQ